MAAPVAVVEIVREPSGQLPSELVVAAYRASVAGEVVLVVDGATTRRAVDAMLDHEVARRVVVAGVRYAAPLPDDVARAARGAAVVALSSAELRDACARSGVAACDAHDATVRLRALADAPPRPRAH